MKFQLVFYWSSSWTITDQPGTCVFTLFPWSPSKADRPTSVASKLPELTTPILTYFARWMSAQVFLACLKCLLCHKDPCLTHRVNVYLDLHQWCPPYLASPSQVMQLHTQTQRNFYYIIKASGRKWTYSRKWVSFSVSDKKCKIISDVKCPLPHSLPNLHERKGSRGKF